MRRQMSLDGQWQFTELKIGKKGQGGRGRFFEDAQWVQEQTAQAFWLKAQVPGDVWQDLIRAKKVPHPFDHLNCPKLQWIEDRAWCYRKTFTGPEAIEGKTELVFEGLDTFAEVFLNGEHIGRTNNMFHSWRFDVGRKVLAGRRNELLVVFPPWQDMIPKKERKGEWAAFLKERVWQRKAQMEFGWDWGPRICLSGIWRPARLEMTDTARIASWHFRTLRANPHKAVVQIDVDLEKVARKPVRVKATLRNGSQDLTQEVEASGKTASLTFQVSDPKLWWPRNLGKANLYTVTLQAFVDGELADQMKGRSGIRTVELLQKPQGKGCKSFTFAVNGKKVFMAGVDWIPAHNFLSSVTAEDYRVRLQSVADGNMNTIRVWGGGIYEDEAFYDICDELGLMVWQDFMFACASYPGDDPAFLASVEKEFRAVVPRLRVHPSIMLWNGNNENQWIDTHAFWDKPGRKAPDVVIYHKVLPKVTRELDGTRPYWPGSPFGGNDENDWRQGNHHSWQVWAGCRVQRRRNERPDFAGEGDPSEIRHYRHYADIVPRFVSEFGLHSVPYRKTLAKYLSKSEFDLKSKALIYRDKVQQPEGKAFQNQKWFLRDITGWAKDYDELELKTQLAQARGMQFAITHYRRNLWQCSGALIWQLNDCWPGFSWSLVDYDLLPKPAYFAVKRAFAPLLLSFRKDDNGTELWAVNTSEKAWKATVNVALRTFDGRLLGEKTIKIDVANDTSRRVMGNVLKELGVESFDPARCYLKAQVVSGNKTFPAWCLDEPVRLNLPKSTVKAKLAVKKAGSQYRHEVTLTSGESFAYFVGIIPPSADCKFEDNFVNIDPKSSTKIVFTAPAKYDLRKLAIRSYNG